MAWKMYKDDARDDMACAACGRVEQCAPHRERELCYDCWHAAREKEPPWMVTVGGMALPMRLLEEEARETAYENQTAERLGAEWEARPAPSWAGERLCHPGYLNRRRQAILAEHPEYR